MCVANHLIRVLWRARHQSHAYGHHRFRTIGFQTRTVRLKRICHEMIKNVGQSESCMVSKSPSIFKQTDTYRTAGQPVGRRHPLSPRPRGSPPARTLHRRVRRRRQQITANIRMDWPLVTMHDLDLPTYCCAHGRLYCHTNGEITTEHYSNTAQNQKNDKDKYRRTRTKAQ